MAPKLAQKRLPLEEPPSASSSSSSEDEQISDKEEETQNQEQSKEAAESEQEEEESEDEAEEANNKTSVQKPNVVAKPPKLLSPSESDEGSDSETHSGHTQPSPTASDFTVKPIASKPMDNPTKPNKPILKPAAKRPAAESEKNDNVSKKKKKTKVSNGDVEEKKSGGAIIRLWSEDDEIVVLKGMIDYQSKEGTDPYADMGEFHEFIKKSLHIDVSKNQLMDKIRRLKKKYRNNAEKWGDPVFSKPHDHKSFELSKKIWGGGKDNNGDDGNGKSGSKIARKTVKVQHSVASPKANGKEVGLVENGKEIVDRKADRVKDSSTMVDKVDDFWSMYPCLLQSLEMETSSQLSLTEPVKNLMVDMMSSIGNEKAKELEKKWKNLRTDQVALYLKRVELIKEQTKLMLDAMKASKD